MLELRGSCERCGTGLPADAGRAFICSFECTFCEACADGPLAGVCPNCGGELVRRPARPARLLGRSPPARPFLPEASHVARAQAIAGACAAQRVQVIADRPGNPLRAETRRIDDGVFAVRAPPFGVHPFNRGYGFSDDHLEAAADVADWFAKAGVPGSFEIPPGAPNERLFALLHARGYRQTGFHAALGGPARLPAAPSAGVEVRRVENAADLEAFADAYHFGWGQERARIPVAPWLSVPGWTLYLGLCDGEPAGAAILSVSGKDGYLADAAVAPAHRRRGVHRALLDVRCADAAAAGAEFAVSNAEYLSGSYRNMLRKGLTLLYTKAIWTVADAQP